MSAVSEIQVTERDAVAMYSRSCWEYAQKRSVMAAFLCSPITQMGENVRIVTRGLGQGTDEPDEARAMAQEGNLLRGDFSHFFHHPYYLFLFLLFPLHGWFMQSVAYFI